jgi:hypothetical protein
MFTQRQNLKAANLAISMVLFEGARLLGGSPALVAAPAERAMTHLCERMDVMEPLFLYHDFGWGGNADFVPSGWMGDTGGLSIDEDIPRPPSGTCIRIQYAGRGWAGVYWQRPAGNWGTVPNAGRDLRPATKATFQAKTEAGKMVVEVGVGGIDGPHGDSAPKTSRLFTLTSDWQTFELDLKGADLTHMVGGLFVALSSPGVVYLDEVTYGASRPANQPRFIPSYVVPRSSPLYPVNQNTAYLYDNALVMTAYACRARSVVATQAERKESVERLKTLADAILVALDHDRYYKDGRLRNAYWSGGDLVDHQGFVRLSGWYDTGAKQWSEDRYAVSSYTGPLTWAALGLLEAWDVVELRKTDGVYLQAAARVMSWIDRHTRQDDQTGGFSAGYEGWEPEARKLLWRSTEHNIDVLAGARRLAQATGDAKWNEMAEHAAKFLERMYSPDGHFWTGTLAEGTMNQEPIPLDCQTWAVLAFADDARSGRLLSWSETNLKAEDQWQGRDVAGYSYSTAEKGVWTEGSAQMGLACLQTGDEARARAVGEALRTIQQGPSGGAGLGLIATCRDKLATGFGEYYYPELSIAATSWFYLLEMRCNPLLGRTIGQVSGAR